MLNLFRKATPAPEPEVQYDVRTQEQRDEVRRLNREIAASGVIMTDLRERVGIGVRQNAHLIAANRRLTAALSDIIAMETPGCAHVGKKMAARARAEIL